MNHYEKLALSIAKTSKARNGYLHVPKKKQKKEKETKILTVRQGVVVNVTVA